MALKDKIRQHMLIAAAAMSFGVGAMDPSSSAAPADTVAVQKIQKTSLLDAIQNNRKITYNGLSFDTPLFRQKQKTNPKLAAFQFHFNGDETGLSIKDGAKTFLVLMPKETLENLISALIAKDAGQTVETVLPANPNEWTYASQFPEILVVENNKRRPVRESELPVLFDKAMETVCACNSENIIDAKKIVQKYAERIGGVTGKALALAMNTLFLKSMQNATLTGFANDYKGTVVASLKDLPRLRAEEKTAFDLGKSKAVAAYQTRMEHEKQLAQKAAEKEAARQASLIAFNRIRDIQIEKNPGQTILLFAQDNHTVEINVARTIFSNVTTFDNKGEQTGMRSLEPEEWQSLYQTLPRVLTGAQKQQLGPGFFQKLTQKAEPQWVAMLVNRPRFK